MDLPKGIFQSFRITPVQYYVMVDSMSSENRMQKFQDPSFGG